MLFFFFFFFGFEILCRKEVPSSRLNSFVHNQLAALVYEPLALQSLLHIICMCDQINFSQNV